MKQVLAFSLLLAALCSCEEQSITQHPLTMATNPVAANFTPAALGGIATTGPSLPLPTIIAQTYIPANENFDDTRCRAWRITWPTYPVSTNANLIPTVFTVKNGNLNSFNYLNNTAPVNTYKATFNLYHNNKLETAGTLWDELIYTFDDGVDMDLTHFVKTKQPAASVEDWVKERPKLFKAYWEEGVFSSQNEVANYQQGDIYLFKITDLDETTADQYGGIRIVSMTPRIIEIYLAESNE